jgi:phosphatidylglycerol:prolipoprotein diacylglycerol transferase
MITRIGCYLFGCDFGQPLKENAPELLKKLGSFPHWPEGTLDHGSGSPAWVQHVKERGLAQSSAFSLPVHPTQLYESLTGLCLLALLLWARRHQKFRGQIFFLFAFAYGVARYLLEILRDDAERGSLPPALPEHILIPLGLVILAVGWCIGFSKAIRSVPLQRATQVASFIPAVLVYLALRPDTFANAPNVEWSTSQFIAITSGFAASVAFAVFYKAALAHPKQAMDLGLPPEPLPEGAEPADGPAPPADEDDEEEVRRPVKRVTKKVKRKPKPAPEAEATEPAAGAGEEAGEGAAKEGAPEEPEKAT